MPHQCVRCGTFYEDGATEILKGCKCQGKLFFYIKKDKMKEAKEVAKDINLSKSDKEQIEKDVFDLVGSEIDKDKTIVLDFESIRVLKPGQYELDLVSMFKKDPVIFKLEEGKYMIDIPESFKAVRDKREKKE
jgi:predicted  nucleic acid-binding Zn-ribbon protein